MPPVIALDAGALSSVTLDLRLMGNRIVGGWVLFEIDYRFHGGVTFSGLHIHRGRAGENGPIVIDSGLAFDFISDTDVDGRGRVVFRVPVRSTTELEIIEEIRDDPGSFYVNLHTTAHPSGALRGQLQGSRTRF